MKGQGVFKISIYYFFNMRMDWLIQLKERTWLADFCKKKFEIQKPFIKNKQTNNNNKTLKAFSSFLLNDINLYIATCRNSFQTAKSSGWDHVVIGWSTLQHNKVVIEAFTFGMVQCIHIDQHWLMEMTQPAHTQNSRQGSSSSLSNTVLGIFQEIVFI